MTGSISRRLLLLGPIAPPAAPLPTPRCKQRILDPPEEGFCLSQPNIVFRIPNVSWTKKQIGQRTIFLASTVNTHINTHTNPPHMYTYRHQVFLYQHTKTDSSSSCLSTPTHWNMLKGLLRPTTRSLLVVQTPSEVVKSPDWVQPSNLS